VTDEQLFRTFKAWQQSGQLDALRFVLGDLATVAQQMLVNALSRRVAKSPEDIAGFAFLQGRVSAMRDTITMIEACVKGEEWTPPVAEF
jgi:hypothetical protein